MAREPSPEIDDELFNEVYGKEYTGPLRATTDNSRPKDNTNKRPIDASPSDEDEARDPNAVPTDFTSREAKVWEAKAKAIERNWKKKKEEEMICKICGESGHFTQGCPSTLGGNRKTAEFFERVPARDKNVRALFSPKVISQIERDVGCKIKMDEKFLIVSGKDRLILAKGIDAVHKLIQEDKGKSRSPGNSNRTRSRSPDGSPRAHIRRSDSQRSHSSPRNTTRFQSRGFNHERHAEDRVRQDMHKFSRGSPQAYANDGAKGRSSRSKSPVHPTYGSDAIRSYDAHSHNAGMHKLNNWDIGRHGADSLAERSFDFPAFPRTLEELEMEFKREATELGRIRDKEEDEENYKHRECIRELRENYMKKLATMRGTHTKQWEEFLHLGIQRLQQKAHQSQIAYNQPTYTDYEQRNPQYVGTGLPMDSRTRYPYPGENYSASRSNDGYGEFQRQRHEDFGKTHGRY